MGVIDCCKANWSAGKLTNSQVEEIKATIKEGAEKAGYLVWDGPSLSDYIKKKYGIDYGIRACQILMHKMGFAIRVPSVYTHILPDWQQNVKKKLSPKLKNI